MSSLWFRDLSRKGVGFEAGDDIMQDLNDAHWYQHFAEWRETEPNTWERIGPLPTTKQGLALKVQKLDGWASYGARVEFINRALAATERSASRAFARFDFGTAAEAIAQTDVAVSSFITAFDSGQA